MPSTKLNTPAACSKSSSTARIFVAVVDTLDSHISADTPSDTNKETVTASPDKVDYNGTVTLTATYSNDAREDLPLPLVQGGRRWQCRSHRGRQ